MKKVQDSCCTWAVLQWCEIPAHSTGETAVGDSPLLVSRQKKKKEEEEQEEEEQEEEEEKKN